MVPALNATKPMKHDVMQAWWTCHVGSKRQTGNTNVFYEAGIAHTLGKNEVILITQSHDDVPFDLRRLRYLHYLNNNEGRAKLAEDILERVQAIT